MRTSTTTMAVLVAVGLAHCGSGSNDPSDASTDTSFEDQSNADVATDASDAELSETDDVHVTPIDAYFEGYNLIDGGTLPDGAACGPSNWFGTGLISTCCNGEVCKGFCEGLPDGSARCSCFGIVDGCASLGPNAACCTWIRGCADISACPTHGN